MKLPGTRHLVCISLVGFLNFGIRGIGPIQFCLGAHETVVNCDIAIGDIPGQTNVPAKESGTTPSSPTDASISQAMASLMQCAAQATTDSSRPVYHYRPPAGWISDPTGPIHYKDYYHTFYIHNPYGSQGWPHCQNHWGHARSRDLVYWEHLPIAMAPLSGRERRCNSGCLTLDGRRRPLIFYTHVPVEKKPNEQWVAVGDEELLTWTRASENPILALQTHGGPNFDKNWRDPFIFKAGGRTFMVLTAKLQGKAVIPIYEAEDTDLLNWTYRGILYEIPVEMSRFLECPNFFKLGPKWVLIGSGLDKHYAVRYFVGSLDMDTLKYHPETQGLVDHLDNFLYATNVFFDDRDRCVLLGRIKHFQGGKAWNGCLALPRLLSLDSQHRLIQRPVPAIKQLRRQHFRYGPLSVETRARVLKPANGDTLEILAVFEPDSAKAFGLELRRSADGRRGVLVRYDGQQFSLGTYVEGQFVPCRHHGDHPDVPGGVLPFPLAHRNNPVTLHVFLDKSVMEVFINNGLACATRVIYPDEKDLGIALFSEQGSTTVKSVDIWTMQSIW